MAVAGLVLLAIGVRPFRIVLFALLAGAGVAALVGLVVNVVCRQDVRTALNKAVKRAPPPSGSATPMRRPR
ncbi:hypothetical protein ACQPW3_14480 [Actinosynnema sp. CA-248983]